MIDNKKIEEAAFDFNDGELTSDKLIRAAFICGAREELKFQMNIKP